MSPLAVWVRDSTHWGNLETLSAWWWWDSPYVSIKAVSVVSPHSLAWWPHSANKHNNNIKHSQKVPQCLQEFNNLLLVKYPIINIGNRHKTKLFFLVCSNIKLEIIISQIKNIYFTKHKFPGYSLAWIWLLKNYCPLKCLHSLKLNSSHVGEITFVRVNPYGSFLSMQTNLNKGTRLWCFVFVINHTILNIIMTNMLEKRSLVAVLAASRQTSQQTHWIKGQTSLGLIRNPHNEQAVNSLQLPLWETRASDHTVFLNLIKRFSRTNMNTWQGFRDAWWRRILALTGTMFVTVGWIFPKRPNKPEQWDYGSARVSMSILSHLIKLCNSKEKQTHLTCFVLLLVGTRAEWNYISIFFSLLTI